MVDVYRLHTLNLHQPRFGLEDAVFELTEVATGGVIATDVLTWRTLCYYPTSMPGGVSL